MGWSLLLQPFVRRRPAVLDTRTLTPFVSGRLRQHLTEDASEPGPFCSGPARVVFGRSIVVRLVAHGYRYASNPDSSAMT